MNENPTNPREQYELGNKYLTVGESDVPKDINKVIYWWTKAAEQGDPDAQYALGGAYHYYQLGDFSEDSKKAAYWYGKAIETYKKLADQGNSYAKEQLATVMRSLEKLNAVKSMSQKLEKSDGCYVATCVYGSYDCPQVWTLRRYRDNRLSKSWFGRRFISVYYAVSPKAVELFGGRKWFNRLFKPIIDNIVRKLQNNGVGGGPYSDA